MKNDVSFVLYDQLLLYEHQSTKNPNIPLRNLFYVSDVYSALTREDFLYGGIPVKIPEPKFVVFYNGVESMEEREVLKLSGLYQKTSEHAALELETVVLNINIGYNRELMERCKELHDYAEFVGRVRENLKSKNPLLHAVNEAVEYCIRNDILAEFLKKKDAVEKEIYRVKHKNIAPNDEVNVILAEHNSTPITTGVKLAELVRRPELCYEVLAPVDNDRPTLDKYVAEQVNIQIKYEGYIKKQIEQVEQFKKLERRKIPDNINYDDIYGLRIEARQKLSKIRPLSVGQASRISGVSPADMNVLMIYLQTVKGENSVD